MPVWDVAVRKRLAAADGHRFELDVAFASDARRLVLFGPSGAGKSLTLKAVAGLLEPDSGHVRVAGETLFDSGTNVDAAPQRRRLAYLFQDYALFPHLTVAQNIGFALHGGWRNPSRRERPVAVQRWLQTFELEAQAGNYPDQLSGGQRQRTALARALVNGPRALLLDEPFAALDARLRVHLRRELAELQRQVGIPMMLITHDEADVAAFADEVIGIEAGRVVAAQASAG
ncbi:MAG: ATP-binding cassette domain-containing protein [Proteobacteria bacterium]|nr:ATP-binding cassette domain-containing protein [Pseudomonadota bacterium]